MVGDQRPDAGDGLYPPLEPYHRAWLDTGAGHRIYFEESGNPEGFPVLFVHGWPGSHSRPAHRRFFDPDFFRIILFDHRGFGHSLPRGSLAEKPTPPLTPAMRGVHVSHDQSTHRAGGDSEGRVRPLRPPGVYHIDRS